MKKTLITLATALLLSSCGVDSEKFKKASKAGDIEFIKENITSIADKEKHVLLSDALSNAIGNGHWELANYLLEQGATGTPYSLSIAIKAKQESIALQMLSQNDELGVDSYYDELEYDGGTPLQYALVYKQPKVASVLLTNGALATTVGKKFHSPLHIAIETNEIEIIKTIIKNSNTLDLFNIDGDSPLCTAIKSGNPEIVQLLLDAGATKDTKAIAEAQNSSSAIQSLILPKEITE